MKFRYINTKFWSDGYTSNLDPIEKLLFIYYITNERVNMAGSYELPLKVAAVETGIDRDMVEKVMKRFSDDGKIIFVDGWVIVKNFGKYQSAANPKIQKAVADAMAKIPERIKVILKNDHSLSISDASPSDTQSHSNSNSDKDKNGDSVEPTFKKGDAAEREEYESIDEDFKRIVEKYIFPILQEVKGYPFDAVKDMLMLRDLKKNYGDRSLMKILTKWAMNAKHVRPLKNPKMARRLILGWFSRSNSRDEEVDD